VISKLAKSLLIQDQVIIDIVILPIDILSFEIDPVKMEHLLDRI